VIAVESLTKRYGKMVAVDGLTFTAREGSILGFLGPNGAGKTTTLRIILGLAHPTSGNATIDGRPYRSLGDPTGWGGRARYIRPSPRPAGARPSAHHRPRRRAARRPR